MKLGNYICRAIIGGGLGNECRRRNLRIEIINAQLFLINQVVSFLIF